MSERPRTLVVGAGVAGLTAANALAARGWTVEVVDADPRPVGVAVGLSASALRPLHALGLVSPVLDASAPSDVLHMCDAAGATLVYAERSAAPGQPYPDNVIVDRPSLARALAEPLEAAGVPIRAGRRVVGAVPDGALVRVEFDGGEVEEYGLVIAADGVASTLRAAVTDARPQSLEQLGLRWVTGPVDGLDHGTMFLGPRGSKLGLWPLASGEVYAFLTLPRPGRARAPREEVLAETAEVLRGFAFPGADRLREAVPWDDVHIAGFGTFALDGPWHAGRLVLAGDAAHVMPPHGSSGAAMAIEDAYVLADELDRADVDTALAAYGARRAVRVARVVDFSTGNCVAENDAVAAGADRAPLMDPEESRRFWAYLREAA